MYYRIRHLTRFTYRAPATESITEVRMHPRTEGCQRCLDYQLAVTPKAQVHTYRDFLGNSVHHFSNPAAHDFLNIMAESVVEMQPWPEPPRASSPAADGWRELDRMLAEGDYWEMLLPSCFTARTPALEAFMAEIGAVRRDDPLSLALEINARIYESFEYAPEATRVDSPIADALARRQGVCQDFAHIMIAVLRGLSIPARYVSGYLHHTSGGRDRSAEGATHAWVDALVPGYGWLGLDPTNNTLARERHIRTAIGRDYGDVPPTRGIYKGPAEHTLQVAVAVDADDELPAELAELVPTDQSCFPRDVMALEAALPRRAAEQEQQQQ